MIDLDRPDVPECDAVILLDTANCELAPGHDGDHMFAGHPFVPFVEASERVATIHDEDEARDSLVAENKVLREALEGVVDARPSLYDKGFGPTLNKSDIDRFHKAMNKAERVVTQRYTAALHHKDGAS